MIQQAGWILQYFLLGYITLQVMYLLFFSIAGKLGRKKTYPAATALRRIRIFIPGYKEDSVIIATAKNAIERPMVVCSRNRLMEASGETSKPKHSRLVSLGDVV